MNDILQKPTDSEDEQVHQHAVSTTSMAEITENDKSKTDKM